MDTLHTGICVVVYSASTVMLDTGIGGVCTAGSVVVITVVYVVISAGTVILNSGICGVYHAGGVVLNACTCVVNSAGARDGRGDARFGCVRSTCISDDDR